MPIYEFICRRCGVGFEVLTALGGEDRIRCEGCGSSEIEKQISSFGIGGAGSRTGAASRNCSTCTSGSCSTCH